MTDGVGARGSNIEIDADTGAVDNLCHIGLGRNGAMPIGPGVEWFRVLVWGLGT